MICNPPSKNVRPLNPGGFVIPQQKKKPCWVSLEQDIQQGFLSLQ